MNFTYDVYVNEEKRTIAIKANNVADCIYEMIERERLNTNKKVLENAGFCYDYQWVCNWLEKNGYTNVVVTSKCNENDEMSIPFGTKITLKKLDAKMSYIALKCFYDIANELYSAYSVFSEMIAKRALARENAYEARARMIEEYYGKEN